MSISGPIPGTCTCLQTTTSPAPLESALADNLNKSASAKNCCPNNKRLFSSASPSLFGNNIKKDRISHSGESYRNSGSCTQEKASGRDAKFILSKKCSPVAFATH